MPFVTQAEIDRQVRTDPNAVLGEERHSVLGDVARSSAKRDVECVRRSRQKRSHAGKVELAGALREIVVEEASIFATEPHRMAVDHAGHGVVEDVERIFAPLRQDGRSAEVQRAGDDHLRQPDRTVDTVRDAEIHWIETRRGQAVAVLRSLAEAHLVQQRGAERVRLVDGQGALPDTTYLSEPWNVRARAG